MLRNSVKVKTGNIKYFLRTNIGREFTIGENEKVECVDPETFLIRKYKPSEVGGKYIIINKPIPVVNEMKTIHGQLLNFKLGHMIGMFLLRTSKTYRYKNKYILYFRDLDLKSYFIESMAGRFDDFNFKIANHNVPEAVGSEEGLSSIEFSSNGFSKVIESLGLKPRVNVCPSCCERLSMDFRKGMMLGMLDGTGFFEYKPIGEAPDEMRHIRVIIRDYQNEYIQSLFKFSDYTDVDFFFEQYDSRSRLTLSSSELVRHRKYFVRCISIRFENFLHDIRGEEIRRLTDLAPLSSHISYAFRIRRLCRGRMTMPRVDLAKRINKFPEIGTGDEAISNWKKLIMEENTRFEKFRKPIRMIE